MNTRKVARVVTGIRTEDGAAFKKQEKIDYRNDSVKLYERLLNDAPANTEN